MTTSPQIIEQGDRVAARGQLSVRDLSKSYDGQVAVSDVSLEIKPGEFFTLLGPSGSGKTTTMMAIAGFAPADRGTILLDGVRLDTQLVESRNLGIVFQNYALFPHMTVRENLAFPLEIRRMSRAERDRRVRDSLELIGLQGREDTFPSQLSGGQQQRVALARALIFEPSILLMDEPLGALDKNMRARLQVEVRQIQRRLRITTIYVTHDQEEAFTMSDRITVMNHGKVEQIGTPAEIYERPATLFVANFVGDNNSFRGTVREHRADATLVEVPKLATIVCRASTVPVGAAVTLTIRPEHMLAGGDTTTANQLLARVTDVTYAGSQTQYLVEIPSGDTCVLKRPNQAGVPRYDIDERLLLNFRGEDVVVHENAGVGEP